MRRKGQPGHRATTAHVQAAYPFVAEGGLGGRGVYIGRDVYGGSFCYDPWELYGKELTSPNAVVIGIVGRAKSSLVKTYVLRQAVFGRQAWIVDVKGEYDRLAEALGVQPITLSPGGSSQAQPAHAARRRRAAAQPPLLRRRRRARTAAHARGEARRPGGARWCSHAAPTTSRPCPTSSTSSSTPPARWRDALAMDVDEIASAVRPMAFALDQLCSGNLRGMFDGPTTPGLDLDAPLVVLNLRAVLNTHTTALGILMTCATAWLQAHDRGGDRRALARSGSSSSTRPGGSSPTSASASGSSSRSSSRAASARRTSSSCTASPTSAPPAPRESREVRLAEGLLADAETKVVYAQPPDQLAQARELLGLTDTEAELLPHLRRGWALWKVGQRSFLVQHRLSPLEREIVDTDARMAVRAAA